MAGRHYDWREVSSARIISTLVCDCRFGILCRGRAISTFTKTDRITAEMAGIAVAFVLGLLGAMLKNAGDNIDEGEV
jgi:hypothetical protein